LINIDENEEDFSINNLSLEELKESLAELDDIFLEDYLKDSDEITQDKFNFRLKELVQN
jgi:hypothetical protein